MKYYKKIHIENLDLIIKDCLTYIKTKDDIYYRKHLATYYPLNLSEFLDSVPLLSLSFKKFELKCNFAAAYVMYKNIHNPIHIDNYEQEARINIPILNCKGTYTKFFNKGSFKLAHNKITDMHPHILHVWHPDMKEYKPVDEVEVDCATVMLVNEPHVVYMDEKNAPRITVTLGFDKDPSFLIN